MEPDLVPAAIVFEAMSRHPAPRGGLRRADSEFDPAKPLSTAKDCVRNADKRDGRGKEIQTLGNVGRAT